MNEHDVLNQMEQCTPFVSKMTKEIAPDPGTMYRYIINDVPDKFPGGGLQPNEFIEQLIPIKFTLHSTITNDFESVDLSPLFRDLFYQTLAVGKTKYLATVETVTTDITQFGTAVPVLHLDTANRFNDTTDIVVRRFDVVEDEEGASLKEVPIIATSAKKLSPSSIVLKEKSVFSPEVDDRVYLNAGKMMTGLPDIFAVDNPYKGAVIDVSATKAPLLDVITRFFSDDKLVIMHPELYNTRAGYLPFVPDRSIELNPFLPLNEVYVVRPSDFILVVTQPTLVPDVALMTTNVLFFGAIVCKDPAMQLKIVV